MKIGDFKYGAKVSCINSPTMNLKFAYGMERIRHVQRQFRDTFRLWF